MDLNILNDYLESSVQNSDNEILSLLEGCDKSSSFHLRTVIRSEISHALNNFKIKTATGPHGISATPLKSIAPAILDNIAIIINSMSQGYFPNIWKKANVAAI